jgi:hypothetical protein
LIPLQASSRIALPGNVIRTRQDGQQRKMGTLVLHKMGTLVSHKIGTLVSHKMGTLVLHKMGTIVSQNMQTGQTASKAFLTATNCCHNVSTFTPNGFFTFTMSIQ